MNDSFWYDFFSEEFEIETWIDFESKIEYLLQIIIDGVKILNNHIQEYSRNNLIHRIPQRATSLIRKNELKDILLKLNIVEEEEGDYNFILLDKFIKKNRYYYTEINIKEIAKLLISELDKFKDIFSSFFRIFIFPLYTNRNKSIDNDLSFSKINYHLTFNYTPTFERLEKIRNKTYFLHGSINSNENNMVLGINDISNEVIKIKEFIPFTKYFQKFNNKTHYKFISEITQSREKKEYQFFLYGHSLDANDKYYINEIFDFVSNSVYGVQKEIIIIYHNTESEKQLLENILHIRGEANIQKLMNKDCLIFLAANSNLLQKKIDQVIDMSLPDLDYL